MKIDIHDIDGEMLDRATDGGVIGTAKDGAHPVVPPCGQSAVSSFQRRDCG